MKKNISFCIVGGLILSVLLSIHTYYYHENITVFKGLNCYPEAKYIEGFYISVSRLSQFIYSVEVRDDKGFLIHDAFITYKGEDNITVEDIISYKKNDTVVLKNGVELIMRGSR